MPSVTYDRRRGQLQTYFDRTAVEAWARLTSTAPVGRIRATVRAGRDRMRTTLLDWLPADLSGTRLLDAGCGTGALAVEAARRGAHVVAVDISPTLIGLAQERAPQDLAGGSIEFRVGDLLDPALGTFDHVVAMDSLIHYQAADVARVLSALSARTGTAMLFTFAPGTPALNAMLAVGRLFPRGDRSPAVEPVGEAKLRRILAAAPDLQTWQAGRTHRISAGFYTSQVLEMTRR